MTEIYKTPLYNEAFNKFLKSGLANLNLEEKEALDKCRDNLGYAYPEDWASELFVNFNSSSVMYREVDHRQPGKKIEYDTMQIKMFASNIALTDPTFSLSDELNEAIIEYTVGAIDESIVGSKDNHSIKGMTTGKGNQSVESQYSGKVTEFDLIELLKRVVKKKDLKWYMNSNTGETLAKFEYLFQYGAARPNSLLNIPVIYNEYLPDIQSGKTPIILANMKESYILDIQDSIYVARTPTTVNDANATTVDGILFQTTITIGGRFGWGDTYAYLSVK